MHYISTDNGYVWFEFDGVLSYIKYIHFQANMFLEEHTVRKIFYRQNGEEVYVDMMHQLAHFKYGKIYI